MTIRKLHKILGELIADGHERKEVCINKSKFNHPLESDGAMIMEVAYAQLETYEMLDGDGGRQELKDGRTAERTSLVLKGAD